MRRAPMSVSRARIRWATSRRRNIQPTSGFGDRAVVDHHHEALEKAAVHSNKIYLPKK